MNKIEFEKHKTASGFEYRFCPNETETLFTFSEYFTANKNLLYNWRISEAGSTIYRKYNIGELGTGENIFFYMLLLSELTLGKPLYAVGVWESNTIAQNLQQVPELISWEYALKHNCEESGNAKKANIGFVKARSPKIKNLGNFVNKTPIDKTGLFTLETFEQFADFLKAGFDDEDNLTNFYTSSNKKELIQILNSEKKPDFNRLLTADNLFIALLVGEDKGRCDYFLIKSKKDISEKLQSILSKIHAFAEYYSGKIQNITSGKAMLNLIEQGIKIYRF